MPSHVHFISYSENGEISNSLRDLKSFTAKKLLKAITENPQESRKEWMLYQFEFYGKHSPQKQGMQFWKHDNHPFFLYSNKMIQQKVDYIHSNPVEAGFVNQPNEWRMSSAYENGPIKLDERFETSCKQSLTEIKNNLSPAAQKSKTRQLSSYGAVSNYHSNTYMTTLSGKLKIDVHDMFSYADDYAYKIYLNGAKELSETKTDTDTLDCPNDTLSFDGLFGDDTLGTLYSYHWDFGNGTTSQLAHPKVFFNTPGTYMTTLIINDNNGITDTLTEQIVVLNCDSSDNRKVTLLNAINIEEKEDGVFKIYPNPTTGIFTLQFSDKLDSGIYVYGTLGNCIWKKQVIASENQNISIDLTDHPKGIYIIKVVNCKGITHIGKLILN